MRAPDAVVIAACLALVSSVAAAQPRPLPPWAYPMMASPPAAPPTADDSVPRHVSWSPVALSVVQTHDRFDIPDWHADGHPAMPASVAHGRKPDLFGCGYCHLPNGQGRPENASLAGLPAAYIVRQVADFRDGKRRSAEPRLQPPLNMILMARHAEAAEVREAATYFAGLRPKRWIRVVETDSVPATRVSGFMLVAAPEGGTEPIGARIIEMPEDLERTELRDDASGFVAYVPKGSVRRGQTLVTKGRGRTQACTRCHGGDLRGAKEIPRLAGRSPSYLVRQLYDFEWGTRAGALADPMRQVVATLSPDDIVAIAAYLSSRAP